MNKVIDVGICRDEEEGEDCVLDGDGIGEGRLNRTGGAANRERQKRIVLINSVTLYCRSWICATQIAFPEPFLGLTTREVLVERFVEGEPMLNFVLKEDEHHSKKDRQELATIGLETVMKMIFLKDFVHADLVGITYFILLTISFWMNIDVELSRHWYLLCNMILIMVSDVFTIAGWRVSDDSNNYTVNVYEKGVHSYHILECFWKMVCFG